MRCRRLFIAVASAGLLALGISGMSVPTQAQSPSRAIRQAVVADGSSSVSDLRTTDQMIENMLRAGDLRIRDQREDLLIPGRLHQRMQQYYRGIPVLGGEVTRQLDRGQLVSAFGDIYANVDLNTQPALSVDGVLAVLENRGLPAMPGTEVELFVLPTEGGVYVLTYRLHVQGSDGTSTVFADANDGSIVSSLSDRRSQSAVGQGTGVLGDQKKISTSRQAGTYVSQDQLRPPDLVTYDLQGNATKVNLFLNGLVPLTSSDLGSKSDNVWTDGTIVDAHVYEGWVYDYYFKRFGRRGLDNNNARIRGIVHPARLADFAIVARNNPEYYANAFYSDGCKCMVYGEGLPPGVTAVFGSGRFGVRPLAAGLDVVAHELTHAVTFASSNLRYVNESGGLNEAFSDMIGTSVEFFYQAAGTGLQRADYLLGEDVLVPFTPGAALRSMAAPAAFGDPDHYGLRLFIGAVRDFDNGGVHTNSGIANHAFYLAIEGGTNRVSGRPVQGVGAGNRDQIEKVFYRAFTSLLPSNATFFVTRTATIQSARDLYGAGSAAERAVTQAWDAVGVTSPGAALTTLYNPPFVPSSNNLCNGTRPSFFFSATEAEFQNVGFTVQAFNAYFYDVSGNSLGRQTFTGADFAGLFNACGAGAARIPGNSQKCQAACITLGGRSAGYALYEFVGTDDNGNFGVFNSDYLVLGLSPSSADPNAALPAMSLSPAEALRKARGEPFEAGPGIGMTPVTGSRGR